MTREAQLLKQRKKKTRKLPEKQEAAAAVGCLKQRPGTVAAKLQTTKKKKTHTPHTHTEGKSCLFPSQVTERRKDFSYLAGESEGQRVGQASGDGDGGWRGCEMYAARRVNLFHMTSLGAVFVNCTLERAKRSQVV